MLRSCKPAPFASPSGLGQNTDNMVIREVIRSFLLLINRLERRCLLSVLQACWFQSRRERLTFYVVNYTAVIPSWKLSSRTSYMYKESVLTLLERSFVLSTLKGLHRLASSLVGLNSSLLALWTSLKINSPRSTTPLHNCDDRFFPITGTISFSCHSGLSSTRDWILELDIMATEIHCLLTEMDLIKNPRSPAIYLEELLRTTSDTQNLGPTTIYCFTLQGVDVIVLRCEHRCNRLNVSRSTTYKWFLRYKVQFSSNTLMQYEYPTKKLTISWVVNVQGSGWVSISNKEIISRCTRFNMTQEYLTKTLTYKTRVQQMYKL